MQKRSSKKIKLIQPQRVICSTAVRSLRETMKRVESGEITGIAVATTERGGEVSSFYDAGTDYPRMIGSIENLKYRVMKDWKTGGETPD